ncbi:hypothetical protein ACHAXS_002782 [Conticribra weissflogii]
MLATKQYKNVILLISFSLVLFIITNPLFKHDNPRIDTKRHLKEETLVLKSPDAVDRFEGEKRAILLISFGEEAAQSTLVERAVLSIRRRGEFSGPVIVLTDAPLERYTGIFDENVVVMNHVRKHLKLNYFKYEAVKYKRFKTYIMDYIDFVPELKDVEWVYYMDIDILLGAPFETFIQELEAKYNIQPSDLDGSAVSAPSKLYFFKNMEYARKSFFANSGFFIAHRESSRECLTIWRNRMNKRPTEKFDQESLNSIVRRTLDGLNNRCIITAMELENYETYPTKEEHFVEMVKNESYTPLIHILNSCISKKFTDEATEEFVANVLMLSKEERKEHKYGKEIVNPSNSVDWTKKKRQS